MEISAGEISVTFTRRKQNVVYKNKRAERKEENKKKQKAGKERGDGNSLCSGNRQGCGALLQPPTVSRTQRSIHTEPLMPELTTAYVRAHLSLCLLNISRIGHPIINLTLKFQSNDAWSQEQSLRFSASIISWQYNASVAYLAISHSQDLGNYNHRGQHTNSRALVCTMLPHIT